MNIDIAATDIIPLYLDSLGIISSLTKELGIADKIDAKLYNNDKRRKVTPGKAVEAMILNTLGFSERALYLTPNFYRTKPVSHLLGNNIKSEDLNDNTLGHALDEIESLIPSSSMSSEQSNISPSNIISPMSSCVNVLVLLGM